MIRSPYIIATVLCIVCVVVTVIAWNSGNFAVHVISGEDSIGTWLSGVMLVISSTCCLFNAVRKHNPIWFLIAGFFLLLVADERFMFHEQGKQWIILSSGIANPSRWIYELPVMFGALIGIGVSWFLWKTFHTVPARLLVAAVLFGTSSVIIDVLSTGVLIEDSFKLLAELAITCAILIETEISLITIPSKQ